MSSYLAIDIGTSSAKVAVYAPGGSCLATYSTDYPLSQPHPNWAEQDPRQWWAATQMLCRRLRQEHPEVNVSAVCVSGQAPSCVPVDAHGEPLRPAVLWLDRRAVDQVSWLQDNLGQAAAEQTGGNILDSYFGGVKWLWFRQNEPELYQKTWKILQAHSYILLQLTGEAATDPSQAGLCSPCFNLNTRQWDSAVCAQMGIDPAKLPTIAASTQVIGRITPAAAQSTGLPAGVPVVCGGGDFACACLGAGVLSPGQAALMLGTAGNLLVPGLQRSDIRLLNTIHLTGDRLSLGGCLAGGALRWFVEMLGLEAPEVYALLEDEARQTPPGAEGLVFLPYLMGERTPVWDAQARGVFIGLLTSHRRGHLFRAVQEGVAFAFREMLDIFNILGDPVTRVVAINGGARSPLWRQIFADVLGVPVCWQPHSGGTMLGGALLAAIGAGDLSGFAAAPEWIEPTLDTFPNRDVSAFYRQQFETYSHLYAKLKDSFAALAASGLPAGPGAI